MSVVYLARRPGAFPTLLAGLAIAACAASPVLADQTIHGSVETTLAYAFRGDQQTLSLSRYDANLRAKVQGKHCDAELHLRLRFENDLGPSSSTQGSVREGTLTCRHARVLYRIGEQSVVWGKADGFHVLDAVDPFDYSNFFLDDSSEARIPLFMGRMEYRPNDNDTLQLLVIPDRRHDVLPQSGGRFAPAWGAQTALARLSTASVAAPMSDPANWQYGTQWEVTSDKIDYTLNYLDKWASEPTYAYASPVLPPLATDYRQQLFGGSFDVPVSGIVVRGEALYLPTVYLPATTQAAVLVEQPYRQIATVVAVDDQMTTWFLSAQLFEAKAFGGAVAPLGGRGDTMLTLLATRPFDRDQTHLRFFAAQDAKNGGAWLSAMLDHQLDPRYRIEARTDLFAGPQTSMFGRIQQQDRLSLSLTRTF